MTTRILDNRVFVIFGVVVLVMAVAVPDLANAQDVQNVLQRSAADGLMAVGLTLVILAGHLDLSVGSTLALAGVVGIGLQPIIGPIPAAVTGVGVGAVVGLLNGLLVVKVGLSSFIATLGMMISVRGFAFLLSSGEPQGGIEPLIGVFVDGPLIGPVTVRSGVLLVAVAIAAFVLARTRIGRNLYAVGGNPESSRLAGINPGTYVIGAFVTCGLAASLAGVLLALSLNTGSPIFGQTSLITVLTAVVLGGTSLAGGRGGPILTLGGILVLAVLGSGLDHLGVYSSYQLIAVGSLLITVVLLDALITRRRRETATRRPRAYGEAVPPR